jgi:hypothetical protein
MDSVPRNQYGPIPLPYPYESQKFQSTGCERPGITPFAPRLPALGYPERSADPRYMPPADNVFMTRQPLPQMLPLRTGTFDPRGYYAPYEEGPNPALGQAHNYDSQQSRTYDVESQ